MSPDRTVQISSADQSSTSDDPASPLGNSLFRASLSISSSSWSPLSSASPQMIAWGGAETVDTERILWLGLGGQSMAFEEGAPFPMYLCAEDGRDSNLD